MTEKETTQILAILKAAYPNSYKYTSMEEAKGTVMIWLSQFANIPASIVMLAIQKHIGSSSFPPSIYEVKKKIQSVHWEAYDLMKDLREFGGDKKALENAQRIYEATTDFRMNIPEEPNLRQFLSSNEQLLLDE